jgi:NifU-like protein involved in Fe-S cluster formation
MAGIDRTSRDDLHIEAAGRSGFEVKVRDLSAGLHSLHIAWKALKTTGAVGRERKEGQRPGIGEKCGICLV